MDGREIICNLKIMDHFMTICLRKIFEFEKFLWQFYDTLVRVNWITQHAWNLNKNIKEKILFNMTKLSILKIIFIIFV